MAQNNVFVVRESYGTYALTGPPKCQPWEHIKKDDDEARFLISSSSGNRFAVGNSSTVTIYDAQTGDQVCLIRNRMQEAELSPNGTYLMGWDNPNQSADNFKIWSVSSKNATVTYALKLSQSPLVKSKVQFSGDESIYARLMSNNVVLFSHVPDFHTTAKKTPENLKIESFSLSTGTGAPHVLCYIPSSVAGTPSFARLYRYPDFDTTIASKSFFQADRVEMKWNQKGTAVLVITYTDVDKTGGSYYGKTMLHYLDTKGSNVTVQTNNDAPVIHAAEWNPSALEFCVITGKMPQTRAALFNSKCEVIFDMGISARNAIYFNRQGNLLLLGGFGNLSHGAVEIWEIKKLKKKVAQLEAPATTQLHWLNDGEHFVTATTAPRRRTDNGFKIWDFTGKVVHEWGAPKEFYGFFPFYSPEIPPFPDTKLDALAKQLGNKIIPPREETKKAGAYVLPHLRKGGAGAAQSKPQAQSQTAKAKTDSVQLTETEKKIKAARKKLDQIQKLKDQQKEGKTLEKNQLEKIASEATLLKEIQALELA